VRSVDRMCVYEEVIDNLSACLNNFATYKLVIGGEILIWINLVQFLLYLAVL